MVAGLNIVGTSSNRKGLRGIADMGKNMRQGWWWWWWRKYFGFAVNVRII